jgi:hypothetical protein
MEFDEVEVLTNEIEWERLLRAWIAEAESEERRSDNDSNCWAVSAVMDFGLDENHEAVWEFIIRAFERKMSSKAFAILAAGPTEDLLADFGDHYIDRVEELARKNPRFNELLGGVWQSSMTDDVWNRVQKVRLNVR